MSLCFFCFVIIILSYFKTSIFCLILLVLNGNALTNLMEMKINIINVYTLIYIYIYKSRHIGLILDIEKVSRWDKSFDIQQRVSFFITFLYSTWCCFTNHFRRLYIQMFRFRILLAKLVWTLSVHRLNRLRPDNRENANQTGRKWRSL